MTGNDVFCCTPSNMQCASLANTYHLGLQQLSSLGHFRTTVKMAAVCLQCRHSSRVFGKEADITPLLREVHWLKVPERIQFRLCVLAYRCFNGTAPSYLAETLHPTADVGSRRHLRSTSTAMLLDCPHDAPCWVIKPFQWLVLEHGMLFCHLFVLRHCCCSSAGS